MTSGASIQRLIYRVERKFCPRRHGELRSTTAWFMGLIVAGLGLFVIALQVLNGATEFNFLSGLIGLGLSAVGALMTTLYWQWRWHFRRYGVYLYRFGKLHKIERYADWQSIRLANTFLRSLEAVRKDGSVWNFPEPEGQINGVFGDILWRVEAAGVPVPDRANRMNRLGIGDLAQYSISSIGRFPDRSDKYGLTRKLNGQLITNDLSDI